jgi:hypothetical protein
MLTALRDQSEVHNEDQHDCNYEIQDDLEEEVQPAGTFKVL